MCSSTDEASAFEGLYRFIVTGTCVHPPALTRQCGRPRGTQRQGKARRDKRTSRQHAAGESARAWSRRRPRCTPSRPSLFHGTAATAPQLHTWCEGVARIGQGRSGRRRASFREEEGKGAGEGEARCAILCGKWDVASLNSSALRASASADDSKAAFLDARWGPQAPRARPRCRADARKVCPGKLRRVFVGGVRMMSKRAARTRCMHKRHTAQHTRGLRNKP